MHALVIDFMNNPDEAAPIAHRARTYVRTMCLCLYYVTEKEKHPHLLYYIFPIVTLLLGTAKVAFDPALIGGFDLDEGE